MVFSERDKIEFEMAFLQDRPQLTPKDLKRAPHITSFNWAPGSLKPEGKAGSEPIDGIAIKFTNPQGHSTALFLNPTVAWRLAIEMAGVVGQRGWYPLSLDGGAEPPKNGYPTLKADLGSERTPSKVRLEG